MDADANNQPRSRAPWWKSIGPALITACVVFGPGSLLISSNVGAKHGYELIWLLLLTGLLMGTYLTMGARIGVCGGASPCTLISRRLGRLAAVLVGGTLCLICAAFQFSNNLAVALAAGAFLPQDVAPSVVPWIVVGFNGVVVLFLFTAQNVYRVLERAMKVMVGVILACFVFNLLVAQPNLADVLGGVVPRIPEGVEFNLPTRGQGVILDPMILVASLVGTTFSVAGAFFQGNLVREKNWSVDNYDASRSDAIAGVAVLTSVSLIIMITAATVLPRGESATDIGTLALTLKPLLGSTAYVVFCVGLVAVAMNPFLINAMIGGTILADGVGLDARMSDRWPRIFTVVVMLAGMGVALWALSTGTKPIELIILGQALTVLGNPLMAVAMLWLANREDVMGQRRNGPIANALGAVGLIIVLLLAVRVLFLVVLRLTPVAG